MEGVGTPGAMKFASVVMVCVVVVGAWACIGDSPSSLSRQETEAGAGLGDDEVNSGTTEDESSSGSADPNSQGGSSGAVSTSSSSGSSSGAAVSDGGVNDAGDGAASYSHRYGNGVAGDDCEGPRNAACKAGFFCACSDGDYDCICLGGERGTGLFGENCSTDQQCGSGICEDHGCSESCGSDAECAAPLPKCSTTSYQCSQ